MTDPIIRDYWIHRRAAKRWARVALANAKDGLPWHEAAKRAHEHLKFALMII
jgi:hypothetical protein